MSSVIRDAPIGQIIRWATKGRLYKYPEEQPDFQCPSSYMPGGKAVEPTSSASTAAATPDALNEKKDDPLQSRRSSINNELNQQVTAADLEAQRTRSTLDQDLGRVTTRSNMSKVNTQAEIEQQYTNAEKQETMKTQPSRPIVPTKTSDGTILVDWYTTDDPENPQNWAHNKKILVVLQIYIYTLAVYIGSAMITPSEPYIEANFGVTPQKAAMGLSMYVLGYGMGPLLFAPMSEIPSIGRNPPYMITFGIFLILSIGTAVVDDFSGLIALRFFQGFFGSPCLATGGASIGDIFSLLTMPYYLTFWAAFATAGPALGPIISGFSVPATNWHWSLWEIVWLAAPVFISLFFLLPETSAPNILLRRAQRLRKLTGNPNLKSQSEIDQANLSVNEVVVSNLWRPVQINALDPAVLFTSLYTGLMYAIFYSFFEVFPIVYAVGFPAKPQSVTQGYGLNAGEIGLIFLSITVGVSIAIPSYIVYLKYYANPQIIAHLPALPAPETRMIPALFSAPLVTIGLFIFAWTGFNSPQIHWIVPTIGVVIVTIGIFIVFQCIFI